MSFPPNGPWGLPLAGFRVSSVTFGPDVDILLDGPSESVRVGLSERATIVEPSGDSHELRVSDGGWPRLAAVLDLIGDSVTSATASDESGLQLAFASRRRITVPLDPAGETWEVIADGYQLVGTPGGVAIYSSKDG
jgi:hypothetical protein